MKKIFKVALCLFFISFGLSAQVDNNYAKNELIVKFKKNKKPSNKLLLKSNIFGYKSVDLLNKSINIQSLRLTGNKKQERTYIIEFNSNQNMADLIKEYKKTNLFEFVEPNYIGSGHGALATTPNDTGHNNSNLQWGHVNNGTFSEFPGATADADMDTDLAWDITQGDPNLVVAVLDSGFKLNHPEIFGRIWINSDETINGSDSDNNGYADDTNAGWDFANNDNNPTDDHGHGTNVAGIAIATGNNGVGYAGMNWNSKIMICKVLDENNSGFYSNWAEGIIYAVDNGADVINLSAGGNSPSSLLEDAVNYAYNNNVPVIVSTGNQNSSIQYPAKYVNAFAVGSTSPNDHRSVPFPWSSTSGSNFGPEIDFVAPGNYIFGLDYQSNTNYNFYWAGTSQAAPQVTGLVSLIKSVNSSLTVDQIRTILEQSSEDQVGFMFEDTAGWDQYYGHGRINAYQALINPLITLSVNDINNEASTLLLYPNPISNGNTLAIRNVDNGTYTINIFNILGQNVIPSKPVTSAGNKIELQINGLSKGTYFVKLQNDKNLDLITRKLIIN